MKLELKHLAPYLPYGLKMKLLNFPIGDGIRTLELDCGHDFHFYLQNNLVRPILKPLSDLTKEVLIQQGFSSHIDFLTNEKMNPLGYDEPGYSHRSGCPLEMGIYLFSQHFDVFGLIPAGLAVDINTL